MADEDHWHAAFGVYICDQFLPPIPTFESPVGIHTHGDGVVHIHPFTAEGAGENARLSVFLEGAGIEVSGDEMRVDGETYTEGEDTCAGDDGDIVLVRWADVDAAVSEPERIDADARFAEDGAGYAVAFVPDGTEVPRPESAEQLDELGAADGDTGASTTTTTSEDDARRDETPAVTDDRTLTDGFYQVEQAEPAPCRTPGMRADMANESCYLLPDQPALGTDAIEQAEPSVGPTGGWQVALTFTTDGIRAFNDAAARCHQRSATCPLGQIALVVDNEIVTAPAIQEPSYERDQIIVSGSFTEDEAQSIADALAR